MLIKRLQVTEHIPPPRTHARTRGTHTGCCRTTHGHASNQRTSTWKVCSVWVRSCERGRRPRPTPGQLLRAGQANKRRQIWSRRQTDSRDSVFSSRAEDEGDSCSGAGCSRGISLLQHRFEKEESQQSVLIHLQVRCSQALKISKLRTEVPRLALSIGSQFTDKR